MGTVVLDRVARRLLAVNDAQVRRESSWFCNIKPTMSILLNSSRAFTFLCPSASRSMRLAALRALSEKQRESKNTPIVKKIAKGHPKRDATVYGIPRTERPTLKREDLSPEDAAKLDQHPLWAFFHKEREAVELPDTTKDDAGQSSVQLYDIIS